MSDSEFKELVNLYLDNEIDEARMGRLNALLRDDPSRQAEFDSYRRIDRALEIAFASADSVVEFEPSQEEVPEVSPAIRFPWQAAGLVAACLAAGFLLIRPVMDDQAAPVLAGTQNNVEVPKAVISTEETSPRFASLIKSESSAVDLDSTIHALQELSDRSDFIFVKSGEPITRRRLGGEALPHRAPFLITVEDDDIFRNTYFGPKNPSVSDFRVQFTNAEFGR